ncbi:MAG: Ig-like domain-containing protein [Bacillota bacterium]|nr:Ig-like domain-containing protein [Bacillota bacterium]
METKQITLRSQTTQCPHCGEYYSVTYKYCPFCDAGRKEEERRQAEKKKNRQAKLGGLFSSAPEKKKKKRPEGTSPKQERPHREAPAERPAREYAEAKPEVRTHTPKEPAKKAPAKKKESLFFKKETRKKTSELTEEEKKARLAEREARAAERKRLRDQAAREAALAEPVAPILAAEDLPEPPASVESAPQEAQSVAAEVPAAVTGEPTPVQEAAAQTTPQPEPVIQDDGADQWEILRELESIPNAPVVEVAGAMPEVTEPAPQVQAAPVETQPVPAAPVASQTPVQTQAAQPQEKKPSVETEEDLDALLSEIRDMLADSPVPQLNPEELKKPAPPVSQTEIPPTILVEGGAHLASEEPAPAAETPAPAAEAPAPVVEEPTPVAEEPAPVVEEPTPVVEEPAPAAEESFPIAGEEPTIVLPHLEDLSTGSAPAVDVAVDDQPTQILPTIEAATAVPVPEQTRPHKAETKKTETKKTKQNKGRSKLLPIILSLIIVVAAAVIVVKQVLPTFQDGLLSGQSKNQEPVAAESLTLDQTDVSLSEQGQTVTLVAALAPEGAAGTVAWASSDETVATVDQNGLVTAVAPGEVTVTAALEGGASAQCVIHCTWTAEETPQVPEGPALSASSITLAAEGETKQLQVTGATGAVKWTSSKPEVATVAEDGTVTAVTKGGATITAEVDGEKLECDVKCIW